MAMMQQVKVIDFNIFDRDLSLEWQNVVNQFRESNEKAKNATRSLIDSSFRRLRSAEGAFELLQNFKQIESKGAIKEQMASKLNDILQQFSREMDTVAEIFEAQRCVPRSMQQSIKLTRPLHYRSVRRKVVPFPGMIIN